jgi:3-oxo-4-pregnene-20-carboxyl-CoA dehydrogenase beta subunit
MSRSSSGATAGMSDAERNLLRKSVRDFLARAWPANKAVEDSGDRESVANLWQGMAGQGLTSLGVDTDELGLRDIVLVFEELGRAACPVPLLGAVVANLTLSLQASNAASALLGDIQQGQAMIAPALGSFDGDPAAGNAALHGEMLRGALRFVESAGAATHLLVLTGSPPGIAIVLANANGVRIRATPGLAVPPLSDITLDEAPAMHFSLPAEALKDIAAVARLACAGRALGAAQRAFDLAVEHAKVRKQFGQFIGQFQAVQHKLANCLINLDGARLAIDAAAEERDHGNPNWHVFASAAVAFAGPALRNVSIETHRALGAIGYAEEHEAPRHFRRVHADLVRFGGAPRARAELADYLLGPVQ